MRWSGVAAAGAAVGEGGQGAALMESAAAVAVDVGVLEGSMEVEERRQTERKAEERSTTGGASEARRPARRARGRTSGSRRRSGKSKPESARTKWVAAGVDAKKDIAIVVVCYIYIKVGVQLVLSTHFVSTIAAETGMDIFFVMMFMFITYTSRLNYRKAFEMTIRAEKSSETVNNIFDSIPDSIFLISKTKNDLSSFHNNEMKINGPTFSNFNY